MRKPRCLAHKKKKQMMSVFFSSCSFYQQRNGAEVSEQLEDGAAHIKRPLMKLTSLGSRASSSIYLAPNRKKEEKGRK